MSLAFGLLSGCGGPEALTPPAYSPEQMAQDALAQYDTNHDGYLDAKELEHCPALKRALETIDKNGDKRLSAEEIADQIRIFVESQVALTITGCRVLLDGRPLESATVTYVPEKFMASAIQPASGVSNSRGSVVLTSEGQKVAGVQPGFYRVQVSKKNAGGQETIPARYNQDTTLGIEVTPHHRWGDRKSIVKDDAGTFRLSSRSK